MLADIVLASRKARFCMAFARIGLVPDYGALYTLPRIVGLRRAAEIVLTNPILTAAQAKELGIINRIVPEADLQEAASAWAHELAQGAPKAMAAAKRLLWSGVGTGVDACLSEEARTVSELSGTADAREGLAAVIERRKPVFTGK